MFLLSRWSAWIAPANTSRRMIASFTSPSFLLSLISSVVGLVWLESRPAWAHNLNVTFVLEELRPSHPPLPYSLTHLASLLSLCLRRMPALPSLRCKSGGSLLYQCGCYRLCLVPCSSTLWIPWHQH
ncbi:hypothetical protein BC826DRAFT_569712 [Russula brevipes]|nr:hypothetical protein BC826DRAFT_569712 [Russula brevipes]